MISIDLNSDLGESFGRYTLGNDEKVLDYVTSVNIACGFHASDPVVMEKTVRMALEKEVAIGAHPGYPDLMGFGRRNMNITLNEARAYIIYQVGALRSFVEAYGGNLQHVKPHGAFYNTAAKDYELAKAIAEAVYDVDSDLILVGLSRSKLIKAAKDTGLKVANEVFADRAYNDDGTLVSRSIQGAVIHDTEISKARVLRMVKEGKVRTIQGTDIDIKADTICIHGDNIKAIEFAKGLKEELLSEGTNITNLDKIK